MSQEVTRGPVDKSIDGTVKFLDDRLSTSGFIKRNIKKVFPDHWSFMLGEIALYSFIILLLSGVYLTFFYKPSMAEIIYDGSYLPLKGIKMTEAYASTLEISFDVRGGLLMRQVHHWGALLFVAAITVHLMRVFFTGAFRKPRELNWVIGVGLLGLAIFEGFAGYSLPDDLLSGTGLRIASGIALAIPVVGTYVSFLIFGGEFPGVDFIPRLYTIHVLILPGILLALITAHLMMVWYQKHTQYPGPGRTNENVVGYPLMPVYMAKAGGFFFIVFGFLVLVSGLVTINPIWKYGPYMPDQVTAGSQPDWYIGWLDGGTRIMPNWEITVPGLFTLSPNILIPAVILPGIMFTLLALYPWIEQWITGDKRPHHILERPRNNPNRTGLGVMSLTFYGFLWISGGNDIIAQMLNLSINDMTRVIRVLIIVVPPLAFVITKRICLSLQHKDRERLLHGDPTGRLLRLPSGEFIEVHEPLSDEVKAVLLARTELPLMSAPAEIDANGVKTPRLWAKKLQHRLNKWWYVDQVPMPTAVELAAAKAHTVHELEEAQDHGIEIAKDLPTPTKSH
jgi:ubiquinol-cytochrome c reductase cytochrome b subunit